MLDKSTFTFTSAQSDYSMLDDYTNNHCRGFQPSIRALVVGDEELDSFRTELYAPSDYKSGPVQIDFSNKQNGMTETMLVRMDKPFNTIYPEWSHRINIFIHVIDPHQTTPDEFEKKHHDIEEHAPVEPLHVIYFINTTEEQTHSFDRVFQSLAIEHIHYSSDNPIHLFLKNTAETYKEKDHPQRTTPPLWAFAGIYCKNKPDLFPAHEDALPLWRGALKVLTPEKFRYAITSNAYEIIHNNLIAMSTDPRYLWDYDEQDFLSFLQQALEQNQLDILSLLYTYLPDLGIELDQPTPLEFVEHKAARIEAQIKEYQDSIRLSIADDYFLQQFDPKRFKSEFLSIPRIKPFVFQEEFTKQLLDAIKNNQLDDVASILNTLCQYRQFLIRKDRLILLALQDIYINTINLSLKTKNIRLLSIISVWFPDILDYYASSPYEMYQDALTVPHMKRMIPSPEEIETLRAFNPVSIRQGTFIPKESYIQLPQFFEALYHRSFKPEQQIKAAYSYALLIIQLQTFFDWLVKNRFKISSLSDKERDSTNLRLIKGLTYPYEEQGITRQKVNRENFRYSKVYQRLLEAVYENNGPLARKCLDIFRRNNIPMDEVLTFSEEIKGILDTHRTNSILDALFANDSLSILKVLCSSEDTLELVQEHILRNGLINDCLGGHRSPSSQLMFLILTDPSQAIDMIDSKHILSVIGYRDIFPAMSDSYILGARNLRDEKFVALDELLGNLLSSVANMKRLTSNLSLRHAVADFVRKTLPRSTSVLKQLYLPLAVAQTHSLIQEIKLMEDTPLSINIQTMQLPGVKYLFEHLTLERIYTFYCRKTGKKFFIRLLPHGIITIAEHREALIITKEKPPAANLNQEIPEQSKGIIVSSGKQEHLKHPTGSALKISSALATTAAFFNHNLRKTVPEFPSQTPTIQCDNRRYIPVGVSQYSVRTGRDYHGFWGSYKTGATTEIHSNHYYKAAVTGACMMGVSFYGQMLNDAGEVVQSISLTHPAEQIPPGFRIDKLECAQMPHVFEHFSLAMLRESIPFIKGALGYQAPLYYDLPTSNYLMYGIKYYLNGEMTEELFLEYVAIIKEHDAFFKRQLHLISQEHHLTIIPRSTLDDVGFTTMSGRDMIHYVRNAIPDEMQQTDYKTKALYLAQSMITCLAAQPGSIGTIYSGIDECFLSKSNDPLLELSRFDYPALYAFVKLESAAQPHFTPVEHDVLGFMPHDEEQIFQAYDKLFAKTYGGLDRIDWIPTFAPQNKNAKTSKLFYIDYGIEELNALIDSGLVHLQSMLVGAIQSDNPQLYMTALQKIIACLSTAEQQSYSMR